MTNNSLPTELQRADALTDVLARALRIADQYGLDRVSIPVEEARELSDLLADSIRTAKHYGTELREYDGTCKPPRQITMEGR